MSVTKEVCERYSKEIDARWDGKETNEWHVLGCYYLSSANLVVFNDHPNADVTCDITYQCVCLPPGKT